MARKKDAPPVSPEPSLPTAFPVGESSTYAARARVIAGMRLVCSVIATTRRAGNLLGVSSLLNQVIVAAEGVNRDAVARLELLDKSSRNDGARHVPKSYSDPHGNPDEKKQGPRASKGVGRGPNI